MLEPKVLVLVWIAFAAMFAAGCALGARETREPGDPVAASQAPRGVAELRRDPAGAPVSPEDDEGAVVEELAPGYVWVRPDPERLRRSEVWFLTNLVVTCSFRRASDADSGCGLELVPGVDIEELRRRLPAGGNRKVVLILPRILGSEDSQHEKALGRYLRMLRDCGVAEVELRRASQFFPLDDDRTLWKIVSLKDASLD